jgi:hypothetical protein
MAPADLAPQVVGNDGVMTMERAKDAGSYEREVRRVERP